MRSGDAALSQVGRTGLLWRRGADLSRTVRNPKAIELLALAYALGVAGTLWDWREHLIGPGTQPPHFVIDLGGLIVLGVLAFSGKVDFRSRSFAALYVLLVLVALIGFGPFVLMMAAPRSGLMAGLMQSMMSRGALLAYMPLVLLAAWGAWRWLSLAPLSWWRIAAASGILVVAIATVWDLYWHQTHPMEIGASMAVLPPHQAILAGFLIGLLGAGFGLAAGRQRPTSTNVAGMPGPVESSTR